jgi:hypothetical protein
VSRVVLVPTVFGKTMALSVSSLVRMVAPALHLLLPLLARRIRTTSVARTVVVVVADDFSSVVVRGVVVVRLCSLQELASTLF